MKPSSSPKAVPARKNPSSMTKPSDTTLKPHMKTEPADPIITGRQAEGHATTTPPSAVGISPDGTHHAEEDLKAVQPRTAVDVDRKAATESNVDKPVVTRPGRVDSLGNHGSPLINCFSIHEPNRSIQGPIRAQRQSRAQRAPVTLLPFCSSVLSSFVL